MRGRIVPPLKPDSGDFRRATTSRLPAAALFVFALLAVSVVVPRKMAGGLALGVDDLLVSVLTLWLVAAAVRNFSRTWTVPVLIVGALWVAIMLHGLILGVVASASILGYVDPPTEMWQYVKRLTCFYVAFTVATQGKDATQAAYKVLFCAVFLAGLIGLAQIPQGTIAEAIAAPYARTDAQLENLVGRELGVLRTYGVAGHSVSWGGFCILMASLAIPWLIDGSRERRSGAGGWRLAALALAAITLLNLAYAGSRSAIVGFAVVVVVGVFAEMAIRRTGLPGFFRSALLLVVLAAGGLVIAVQRFDFLARRFVALGELSGGDRMEQVLAGSQLLDSYGAWFVGVGNAVQRLQTVSYGVEVEPVYLVVNYGIFGALMRYALLLVLAYMALRAMRDRDGGLSALNMSGLLLIAGYLVFSVGYFFFQELFVGLTPWLALGLVAGNYQNRFGESSPGERHPGLRRWRNA